MATVADLIRASLRTIGALAASETPTAAEQTDALSTLNDLLDSWAGERLTLFSTLRSEHALTAGLGTHTLGTGGDINTDRPVRIDRASIVPQSASGSEFPLELLSDGEWQARQGKGESGRPSAVWVEPAYPLMKLHFNPIPDAADTLVLYTWQQIGRFTSTSATLDLPPGYLRALRFNLARELAPEFGVSLSGEALAIADESKATLKRLNQRVSYLRSDPAVLGRQTSGTSSMSLASGGSGGDGGELY